MYTIHKVAFYLICIIAASFPVMTQASLGISPAQLGNDHVLAGTTLHYTLTASSGDIAADTKMELVDSIQGDIESWVELSTDHLTLSADQPQSAIDVTVQVPGDATVGKYTGSITINEVDQSQMSSGADLHSLITLSLPITITVVQDVYEEYTVSDVNVLPQSEQDTVALFFTVDNTGNVANGPDRAKVTIMNSDETEQVDEIEVALTDKTKPFTYATETAVFTKTVPVGSYWLTARILDGAEERQVRKLRLEVVSSADMSSADQATRQRILDDRSGISATADMTTTQEPEFTESSEIVVEPKQKSSLALIGLIGAISSLIIVVAGGVVLFKRAAQKKSSSTKK